MAATIACSSLFASRAAAARPVRAGRRAVTVRAAGAAWFPGTEAPAHLAAKPNLPGNFGFDPLGLGKDEQALNWFVQAELQNGRWAMLGVAGILFPELLRGIGLGGPAAKVAWYDAGAFNYFAPPATLFAIMFFLFAWVEIRRLQDIRNPGSVNEDPIFKGNKLPAGEVGYPGGIFDPLGFAKGDLASLKQKEIKNARLAMMAFLGFVAQHSAQGGTPLENLGKHLSNPWANHFITNGVSLPFTASESGLNILGGSL